MLIVLFSYYWQYHKSIEKEKILLFVVWLLKKNKQQTCSTKVYFLNYILIHWEIYMKKKCFHISAYGIENVLWILSWSKLAQSILLNLVQFFEFITL